MAQLNCNLVPQQIPVGKSAVVQLSVQHDFTSPLFETRFRILTSPNLTLLGQKQFRLPTLDIEQVETVELRVQANKKGLGYIRIERASARAAGRSVDLNPVQISVMAGDERFRPESLTATFLETQTSQKTWSTLRLRIFNNNFYDLHSLTIDFFLSDGKVETSTQTISLPSLNANDGVSLPVIVYPNQAGDQRMNVCLTGFQGQEKIFAEFDLLFSADRSESNIAGGVGGDSITFNRTTIYGTEPGKVSRQKEIQVSSLNEEADMKPIPNVPEGVTCPACGKKTQVDAYCNYCGERLLS